MDIITLKADKTRPNAEIDELLSRLGNKSGSIPFYAIFPAGNPNQPILLDGVYTSPRRFVEEFQKAGPSLSARQPGAAEKPSVAQLSLEED